MQLHVIGTGSKGNCYALEASNGETLLLECGVNFEIVKHWFNFELKKIIACLVTHEHGDHVKGVKKALMNCVSVFGTPGTIDAMKIKHHRLHPIQAGTTYKFGSFKVWPFRIAHDAAEPCGYLISHKEFGRVLFCTDTSTIDFKFHDITTFIVEANYDQDQIDKNYAAFLAGRIKAAHMSLDNCIKNILYNGVEQTRNIVIAHMSDTNIDIEECRSRVQQATGKNVIMASNKTKFKLL